GDFEKNIINKVALINKLYSDANWYIGKAEMLPDWWDTYSGVLPNMLDIWHKLPEIGFLLLNMMDIDPAKRMSAKGVIEYLGGKCKPMHRKIALFSNVTAEQLKSWIKAELNLWTLRKTDKEDRYLKFVQNLEKTLKKAVKYQENFQKELDTRTAHCET
uniref:DHC_N2 domain-containing protein n=1 Tax=Globodera pallida TaxID=36090 RepID=A0A183CQS0_GLOPA